MILQLAYGLAMIVGLLAVQAAALYAIGWFVLLIFRYVPLVGKKHRHENWERLNRPCERWGGATIDAAVSDAVERPADLNDRLHNGQT